MVTIRHELATDAAAREALLTRAFGKGRKRKTSERLREGRLAAEGLAFTATDGEGRLVGTLRLWNVIAGSAGPALLLGPLAVDCSHQKLGIGAALMRHALAEAVRLGHVAVLLVGDAPYYSRFGFSHSGTDDLHLPGPVERARFLGIELAPGALAGAEGLVVASGRPESSRRAAA
jgi:predicted N-acetyltransferase YhbS